MAPGPQPKPDTIAYASVELHPLSGAYTLRWSNPGGDARALILANTDPNAGLNGRNVIAASALPPFTWVPEEPGMQYHFVLLLPGARPLKIANTVAPAPDGPLEGRWLKSCGLINTRYPKLGYDVVDAIFIGASYSASASYFADSACHVPLPGDPPQTVKGQIHIGETVDITGGDAATALDVLGSTFLYSELPPFTIFRIDGDTLRVGDARVNDGTTPHNRPDTLFGQRIYKRQ